MVWDKELEDFKSKIDLREYATELGYALDRRESWRGSSVMRKDGDKIVIKLDGDGHYVYFSVRDDRDNGSIIDFIQFRKRLSLGEVRKELRPWISKWSAFPAPGSAAALPLFPKLEKSGKDRMRVEMEIRRMKDAGRHPYLEQERRLPAELLGSERFAGRILMDARGNAVFPHFDQQGLCGYELKNRGFTGFSRGGEKGLWFSRTGANDSCLVFAESAIDALSYAALHPDGHARYASIGGETNSKQPCLIRAAIAKMPAGAEIISAMDNDEGGRELSAVIADAFKEVACVELFFREHLPPKTDDDWNQVLQDRPSSLPTARFEGSVPFP